MAKIYFRMKYTTKGKDFLNIFPSVMFTHCRYQFALCDFMKFEEIEVFTNYRSVLDGLNRW